MDKQTGRRHAPTGAAARMGWQDILQIGNGDSAAVRTQYAALCWRPAVTGLEVLLITSRDSGRWIIPKGWPIPGLAPEATAAQEAWEEAGVEGEVSASRAGRYGYVKTFAADNRIAYAVSVYGLQVQSLADSYPEAGQRRREWFAQAEAATLVAEPELAALIARFAPPQSGRRAPVGDDA